jgi:DNA mismatch repair ATPase MutL
MKTILGTMLGVTMAVSPLLVGQEPTPEKEKQKQEEPKKQPPPNQQEPQTEKPKPKPEKQQQQQEKEKQKQAKEEEKKSSDNKQQPRQNGQQNSQTQQSTQASHSKGQRIPPEKFQASFGSQHHFHVQHLQDGRRFQHDGYWFEIVEVWPADWSYADDCYIEEDAGEYYLVDLYHPDTRVSVIVIEG